jgi:hypothetical protein
VSRRGDANTQIAPAPRRRFVHALTLAGIAAALALSAMASSYFPEFYHVWNPEKGHWSTYRITDSRGETADLTFAVVDKDTQGIWLELRTRQEGAEAVAAFLVKGDPTDDANVLMVRAQDVGGPAMQIDRATLEKLRSEGQSAFGGQAIPIGPTVGKLEGLPDETLTVGGHKLKCRHLKVVGREDHTAEVWLNDDIVPFGIVKLVSGTEEVVLQDYGKGAKPSLKGPFTPLSLP